MRRADRLFQIVQILRARGVVTARDLAERLYVSTRTIYRDIDDLSASGVPIDGEPGVGYRLRREFDLPPLMFDETEVEALVLGARMVKAFGDEGLARAAESVLEKVQAVLPRAMERRLSETHLYSYGPRVPAEVRGDVGRLREAIDRSVKARLAYEKPDGTRSERVVRPLGLFFWGRSWTLLAWCELRDGHRNFRVDRIAALELTGETFEIEQERSVEAYLAQYQ